MINTLKCIQINCQRSSVVASEINNVIRDKVLDMALLQEPYHAYNNIRGLPLYLNLLKPSCETPMVAAACRRELDPVLLSRYSSRNIMVFSVHFANVDLFIMNVYCQFGDDIDEYLRRMQTILDDLNGKNVIIAIDSNAKSPLWFSDKRDLRGQKMEDLIFTNGLILLNREGQPKTFSTVNGESNIDLTLATMGVSRYIKKWEVEEDWCVSDHRVIYMELCGTSDRLLSSDVFNVKFNVLKADWEIFYAELFERKERFLRKEIGSAEELAVELQHMLREVTSCAMPVVSMSSHSRKNYWWNEELEGMRSALRRKRRRYQAIRYSQDASLEQKLEAKRMFTLARNRYCDEIRKCKRDKWQEFVGEVGNHDPWGLVYKFLMEKLTIREALSSIKLHNNESYTYQESMNNLLNALMPREEINEYSLEQRRLCLENEGYTGNNETVRFTVEDLMSVLGQLKTKKAPGEDGLSNEIIDQVARCVPELLLTVFNRCIEQGVFPNIWKVGLMCFLLKSPDKDRSEPRSYRPICLLPVLGKLLERLIVLKLKCSIGRESMYHTHQYGFVEGKSTVDAIKRVVSYVKNSSQQYVVAILFDIEGAFDGLWWPWVFRILRERNCPQDLYDLLRNYLSNRRVKAKSSSGEIIHNINRGCPQGSVLGPVLWNLTYDTVLEDIQSRHNCFFAAYADDLIVAESGSSRRDVELKLQAVVDTVQRVTEKLNLKISIKKTEGIVLKGKLDLKRPPTVKLYGKNIKFVSVSRYLGVYFGNGMTFKEHVKTQRDKLLALTGKLLRVGSSNWGLNKRTLGTLYKGVFLPILTYGGYCWFEETTRIPLMKMLWASQRPFLLMLTRACRTVSNAALHVLAGVLPADLQVVRTGLIWAVKRGWAVTWKEIEISAENVLLDNQQRGSEKLIKLREVEEGILKEWQRRWDSEEKGRMTYKFIREVGTVRDNSWISTSYKVTSFLSGHGFFRANLVKLGLEEDPECGCGQEQTADHLLMECRLTLDCRRTILGGEVPDSVEWFMRDEENFGKFVTLVQLIFDMHERDEL